MKTTRWRPGCGCVLEYSWDPSVPEDEREHVDPVVVEACERHDHDDPDLTFLAAHTENVEASLAAAEGS